MRSFKENLRSELDYQRLTVKELAARTGIIKGTLDNYLGARESIPPADIAVRIARALNVSVEYLVTGEEPAAKAPPLTGTRGSALSERSIQNDFDAIPKPMQDVIKSLIHQAADTLRSRG